MLSPLPKLLLLTTILAHAMFGCCLHHQHQAAASHELSTGSSARHAACSHGRHEHTPADSSVPATRCADENCLYVDTRCDFP
ncbi:MAG: hypothetical protein ACKON9_20180, partial [Planctomycetaceae bacterium]